MKIGENTFCRENCVTPQQIGSDRIHLCGICSAREKPQAVAVRQDIVNRLKRIPAVAGVDTDSTGPTQIRFLVRGKNGESGLAAIKIIDGQIKTA